MWLLFLAFLCDYHPKMKPSNCEPVLKRWSRACQEDISVHWYGLGLGSAWKPCPGAWVTQSNPALRPADAELCEASCGEGKLLTSFLLALNLPFCLFVSLRGPKEWVGMEHSKAFLVKDLGFLWSVQSREAKKDVSKNVRVQWDLKHLKQNSLEKGLLKIIISWTLKLLFLGKGHILISHLQLWTRTPKCRKIQLLILHLFNLQQQETGNSRMHCQLLGSPFLMQNLDVV